MRETGYYLVKVAGCWEIAHYDNKHLNWERCGFEIDYEDSFFDMIVERKINLAVKFYNSLIILDNVLT